MSILRSLLEKSLMPDVAELYPVLAALDWDSLNKRREALLGDRKTWRDLNTQELQELSAIANLLRRKTAGPPKEKKKPSIKSVLDLNVQ